MDHSVEYHHALIVIQQDMMSPDQQGYFHEITLISPSLNQHERELVSNWDLDVPPPPLAGLVLLPKSFSTKHWDLHQSVRASAHPGTLFELYTNLTVINPNSSNQLQTYALLRITHPQEWIKFSIHYHEGESIRDIVLQYLVENNLQVNVSDVVPRPELIFDECIASLRLVPTPIGSPIQWEKLTSSIYPSVQVA